MCYLKLWLTKLVWSRQQCGSVRQISAWCFCLVDQSPKWVPWQDWSDPDPAALHTKTQAQIRMHTDPQVTKSRWNMTAHFRTWASQLQPHAYTSPVLDRAKMCSQPTAMSSMNTPSKAGTICGRLWFFSMESGRPIRRSVKTEYVSDSH